MFSKLITTLALLFTTHAAMALPETMPEGDAANRARGWTPWVSLGGGITSDPAACTAGNWTWVFARGTDNTIFYRMRSLASGVWGNWTRLSTRTTTASPAAACIARPNGTYEVSVFINGPSGNLYRIINTGAGFGGWQNLGGVLDAGSGPAAVGNPVGDRLEIIVRGTDHTFFRKYRYYGRWSSWQRVSSQMKSDPAVSMAASSHFDIFGVSPSNQLYSRFWEGGLWYSPVLHAGQITSSPDAVSRSLGTTDVFARGPNNELLQKSQVQGGWGSWISLGGILTSGPGATTYADNNRMFVFVRGTDGALWYRAWAP